MSTPESGLYGPLGLTVRSMGPNLERVSRRSQTDLDKKFNVVSLNDIWCSNLSGNFIHFNKNRNCCCRFKNFSIENFPRRLYLESLVLHPYKSKNQNDRFLSKMTWIISSLISFYCLIGSKIHQFLKHRRFWRKLSEKSWFQHQNDGFSSKITFSAIDHYFK